MPTKPMSNPIMHLFVKDPTLGSMHELAQTSLYAVTKLVIDSNKKVSAVDNGNDTYTINFT
jgi:hypothetical protein